jgi:hypothetical protein
MVAVAPCGWLRSQAYIRSIWRCVSTMAISLTSVVSVWFQCDFSVWLWLHVQLYQCGVGDLEQSPRGSIYLSTEACLQVRSWHQASKQASRQLCGTHPTADNSLPATHTASYRVVLSAVRDTAFPFQRCGWPTPHHTTCLM